MKKMFAIFAAVLLNSTLSYAASPPTPVVTIKKIETTTLSDNYLFPARTTSKVQAAVLAPVDGVVMSLSASVGQSVGTGQPIMRIKNTDPIYEFVPLAVQSPVSGVVSTIDVSIGSRITKGQTLGYVVDPDHVVITVELPSSELPKFRRGLEGEFSWGNASSPDAKFPIIVSALSPMVDPATGTVEMELKPKTNGKVNIPLGMIGRAQFALNERSSIEVPQESLVFRGKDTFVRTVVNEVANVVPVEVAATKGGRSEIKTGLKVGDLLIIRSSGFVDDGQKVAVKESDAPKR
ncbi:MAG: efflux RND transporter periplasmic adaptor subunit [Oligoflexales bacterium]